MDTLCLQEQYEKGRWFFAADMNCDGLFTISDIWPLIEWVFFVPGDAVFLVLMLVLPGVATFFEITPASFGGWFSGIVSLLSWSNVPFFVVGVWGTIKEDE